MQIAIITGAASGLAITMARLLEPGLVTKITRRIRGKPPLSASSPEISSPELSRYVLHRSGSVEFTRKRSSSFTCGMYYGEAISHNSQQFAHALLISLHYILSRYESFPHNDETAMYELSPKALETDRELSEFVLENS
jgi:hypothetical protein